MRVPTEKELNTMSRGINSWQQRTVLCDMAEVADSRGDHRFASILRAMFWTACCKDSLRNGDLKQAWRDRASARRNLKFARIW
jgi:hypothetical protein